MKQDLKKTGQRPLQNKPKNAGPKPFFKAKPHEGIDQNTVYVSNLSYQRDREGLKKIFIHYGDVVHIKIVMDKNTNKSTGMAFVEMKNYFQANKAITELNGQIIDGRTVKAAPAIPMKKAPAFKARKSEAKTEAKPSPVKKLSKDSMASKEAKAKRRKETSLGHFLATKK